MMGEEKRGPGQPQIGTARRVTLPDDDWAEIGQRADDEGVSRAEVVRRAIRLYLDA